MSALPAKAFYMIRHGETVANASGVAAGSVDTPLTDKGRRQAAGVRACFEDLCPQPRLIVHSNLSRARDTALILNEGSRLPMQENALIAEHCFGAWAGLSWEGIQELLDQGQTPPEGESRKMFGARALRGLAQALSLPEEPLLIVTHGGVFHALAEAFNCTLTDVKNCHLYAFLPCEGQAFPWEVWHHDRAEDGHPVKERVEVSSL